MIDVRIIGIGSPFGDDRIGWDAVDAIEKSGVLARFPHGMVSTFCCSQPAIGLLPLLTGADAAILIDAMRSGASFGTVRKINASVLRFAPRKISSHGLSLPESLALGRELGLLPETMVVYGIEIQRDEASAGVQDKVHAPIPGLLRAIAIELETLMQKPA